MRRLVVLPLLLLVAATAADEIPRLIEPFPFEHGAHGDVFRRTGITCVDCHPVGLRVHGDQGYSAPDVDPAPRRSSCHGCHRAEFWGAPRSAPNECMVCHADRLALKPTSHGVDWVSVHGQEARVRDAECGACHEPVTCVDCHEARGPLEGNPHPPGFRSFHGVEARLDSMSCSTCHGGEACEKCHTTGAIPW